MKTGIMMSKLHLSTTQISENQEKLAFLCVCAHVHASVSEWLGFDRVDGWVG